MADIVVTGIGVIAPGALTAQDVLQRATAGSRAGHPPSRFDPTPFACRVCAEIADFDPKAFVPTPKLARLMNRDAQLAVAAARLAVQDAGFDTSWGPYRPEEVALFGATGTAGLPLPEVTPLLRESTGPDGTFDPSLFGTAGLRSVTPLLSFKILSNMPLCFVSMCTSIQGANSIYTPWEGHGAQAIMAALHALEDGDARCALVGGCDVKTHELAFLSLEQQGAFDSWIRTGRGAVPAEGSAFLVLEHRGDAEARGARSYGRLRGATGTREAGLRPLHEALGVGGSAPVLVSCDNGDAFVAEHERAALADAGTTPASTLCPKLAIGDVFAGAAAVQVAVAALLARNGAPSLAHCCGHGTEIGAFATEPV